ncbi:hypothetical protein [Actinomadura rugatobispora]|uniref:Uncharacterized protein n=1 Tax=Actinomadura rugatobispora TaxID=1994 RepID=A0ABW0ZRB9_9ACTN
MADLDWEAGFAARLDVLAAEDKREFVREFCDGAAPAGPVPSPRGSGRRARWGFKTGVLAGVTATGLALGSLGVAYYVLGPADHKSGSMHLADPGRSDDPGGPRRSIRISWPDKEFVTDGTTGRPRAGAGAEGIRIGGRTYTSGWVLSGGAVAAERVIDFETSVARGDLTAVVAALGTSEPCRWTATAGGVRKSVRASAGGHEAFSLPIDRSTDGVTVRVERESPQAGRPEGSCVMAGIKVQGRPAVPDERVKPSTTPKDDRPPGKAVERVPVETSSGPAQPSPPVESPSAEPVQPDSQSPAPAN